MNQTEFINTTGSVSEQETFDRLLIRSRLAQRWFIKPQNFSKAPSLSGGILLTSSLKPDVTLSIIISSQKNKIHGGGRRPSLPKSSLAPLCWGMWGALASF